LIEGSEFFEAIVRCVTCFFKVGPDNGFCWIAQEGFVLGFGDPEVVEDHVSNKCKERAQALIMGILALVFEPKVKDLFYAVHVCRRFRLTVYSGDSSAHHLQGAVVRLSVRNDSARWSHVFRSQSGLSENLRGHCISGEYS
jgi:hypothetical protein